MERAGADLGAEHGVADHEAAMGIRSAKSPTAATWGNTSPGGASDVSESRPSSIAPTHGNASVHHRLAGIDTRSV